MKNKNNDIMQAKAYLYKTKEENNAEAKLAEL